MSTSGCSPHGSPQPGYSCSAHTGCWSWKKGDREKDYGLTAVDVTSLRDRTLAEGFGYANYPDTPGYGISISQPTWIRALVGRETALQVLAIHESAWNQHQDAVVCSRRNLHPAEG